MRRPVPMRFTPWTILSLVLLAAGVLFWIGMGLAFGRWTDIGVYSVAVVLIGFGIFGFLAARAPKPERI